MGETEENKLEARCWCTAERVCVCVCVCVYVCVCVLENFKFYSINITCINIQSVPVYPYLHTRVVHSTVCVYVCACVRPLGSLG